jgi:hypothetical protein
MAVKTSRSGSNQAGSTSWIYDGRGRMTSETRIVDDGNYVTDTAYDSADRAATLTYPANASGVREGLSYAHNAAGQLIQVRSDTSGTPLFDLRYLCDNAGNMTRSQTAATGTTGFSVVSYSDSFDRTATLSSGQGLSVRFKVDSVTPNALWAIETTDSSRRFAIYARYGKLTVQYSDGSGWRYPVDLITALQANTWNG